MAEYAVIGHRVPLVDAALKALGHAQYVEDIVLPNMLYGKVLRSPLAHAKLLHIDADRARALAGVKAIITSDDIPGVRFGFMPPIADQPALAAGKVRHVGEAVVAVAAVDEETAQEALELIRVEYEPLPAVFDPVKAMEPGAPLVHEERPNNIGVRHRRGYGDVEGGFAAADHIRQDAFRIASKAHAALEPHGAVALWHPDGSLTLWTPNQRAYPLRSALAMALGVREDKIRIIKPAIGGAFGGKSGIAGHELIAPCLAKVTGRPVKLILGREEVFLGTHVDYSVMLTVKTGVKRDGTITAREARATIDGGAYTSSGPIISYIFGYYQLLPYMIPSFQYEGCYVYTNKPQGGPWRGHGNPAMRFATEVHLDMLAEDLGMDPLELRLKNAVYVGYHHPGKLRINSCGFREAIEAVAARLGWRERRGRLPPGRGLGIACSSFPSGVRFLEHAGGEAIVKIDQDGGVHLLAGVADIGQGAKTVLCQIVAEELGLRVDDIAITSDDTAIAPFDLGTFASGVTFRAGNAALGAVRELKRQLLEVVAPRLEAEPEEIEFGGGRLYLRDSPERGMSLQEATRLYSSTGPMPLLGRGAYIAEETDPTPVIMRGEPGNISPAYSFMAQGAEVEVGQETGQVKVLRVVTAHDCGRVINLNSIEGQFDGSVVMGMGMALYEDLPHVGGRFLNASFMDYALPTTLDVPEMSLTPIESQDPLGPFGAKESGEGNAVPTAAAIANAIYNASGARLTELPITPDKILRSLAGAKRP